MIREKYISKLNDISLQIIALGEMAAIAIEKSLRALKEKDEQQAQNIINADEYINHQRFIVEERLVSLIAKEQPVAHDLRLIVAHLVVTTELERIGDYAANNAKNILKLDKSPTAPVMTQLHNMSQSVVDMLRKSLQAYGNGDTVMAVTVGHLDDIVDEQYDQVYMDILQTVAGGTMS
ncbi:MAG: phosphate signaling complex protein PhoU, partial [Chloroflexi bacterium]|nr:phosphate signaling complex protein PhoU [Chloroflexota bacterium]